MPCASQRRRLRKGPSKVSREAVYTWKERTTFRRDPGSLPRSFPGMLLCSENFFRPKSLKFIILVDTSSSPLFYRSRPTASYAKHSCPMSISSLSHKLKQANTFLGYSKSLLNSSIFLQPRRAFARHLPLSLNLIIVLPDRFEKTFLWVSHEPR